MYFSVFVPKFNISNIYANFQYLYKSSIFVLNLQYLRICFPLSGLCTSRLMSYFRSQREGLLFRFCPICVKIFNLTYLFTYWYFCPLSVLCTSGFIQLQESERGNIIIFICIFHIFVLLSLFCVQADLSSFRSQREGKSVFICIFRIFVHYLNHLLTGKILICSMLLPYSHLVSSFGSNCCIKLFIWFIYFLTCPFCVFVICDIYSFG